MNKISCEMIKKIEKALGFKLYPWQTNYLLNDFALNRNYRGCGNTTIYAIKKLITINEEIDIDKTDDLLKLIDYCPSSIALKSLKKMIIDINDKLLQENIKTCVKGNKVINVAMAVNVDSGKTLLKVDGKNIDLRGIDRISFENGPIIMIKPGIEGYDLFINRNIGEDNYGRE